MTEYTHTVEFDHDGYFETISGKSFDFGDEYLNAEYIKRFNSGELGSYRVLKYKTCECCKQKVLVDSLHDIHAESGGAALAVYFEYNGGVES